jgi:hypothetical protein
MTDQYEVLTPWADADPVPPRAISPRLKDLAGKTIGLYSSTYKMAARPVSDSVARQLQEKFPTVKFIYFDYCASMDVDDSEEKTDFYDWVKIVDAVIAAVGD